MRIFINYRRDDSAGHTGRLYDHLANRFGANNIFMDIDTIQPGEDFTKAVEKSVKSCDAFLVIIGKNWLNISDHQGNRRLDNHQDWVRIEISTALKLGKHIIPVLVQDAEMPGNNDLPDELKNLAFKNAVEISDTRFKYDAGRLAYELEKIGVPTHFKKNRSELLKNIVTITSTIVVIGIIAAIYFIVMGITAPQGLLEHATQATEFDKTIQSPVVVTNTQQTAIPEISSVPTEVVLSPSSTPLSTHLFEDGCIDRNTWSLLQGKSAPEENNCWKLGSHGIVAEVGAGLLINVVQPPNSQDYGLVTEIPTNADVNFDMQIGKLSTISEWNTHIAVGLLPNAISIPSQDGTNILFQTGQPNKPIWMMMQIPDLNQIYLPPPRISPNRIYNVKLEIRGKRLVTYLDYENVDDRNLNESNSFFWVGYTVAEGGTLSVTLSNFSIDRK